MSTFDDIAYDLNHAELAMADRLKLICSYREKMIHSSSGDPYLVAQQVRMVLHDPSIDDDMRGCAAHQLITLGWEIVGQDWVETVNTLVEQVPKITKPHPMDLLYDSLSDMLEARHGHCIKLDDTDLPEIIKPHRQAYQAAYDILPEKFKDDLRPL